MWRVTKSEQRLEAVDIFITAKLMTEEQAQRLNATHLRLLQIPVLYELVLTKQLTSQQLLDLSGVQSANLQSPAVLHFIKERKIPIQTALNLRYPVESKTILTYILSNRLSEAEAFHLTEPEISNLQTLAVRQFIDTGELTVQQAVKLSLQQRGNLTSRAVSQQIRDKKLTLQVALELSIEERRAFDLFHLMEPFLSAGLMTEPEVSQLSEAQIANLQASAVREFIRSGALSVQEAIQLTSVQCRNLMSPAVQKSIADKKFTFQQALDLSDVARIAMQDEIEGQAGLLEQARFRACRAEESSSHDTVERDGGEQVFREFLQGVMDRQDSVKQTLEETMNASFVESRGTSLVMHSFYKETRTVVTVTKKQQVEEVASAASSTVNMGMRT